MREEEPEPVRGGRAHPARTLAQMYARPPRSHAPSALHIERAYAQGVLPAEELLALPPAHQLLLLLAQGNHLWARLERTLLCLAEPDLVEELLVKEGSALPPAHQLLCCLNLLRHGGAAWLATVAGRNLLGRTATTVSAKALASADPGAVLRARLDRELAPAKLVSKLRRARYAHQTREAVTALSPGEAVDREAVEAAHARDPIPFGGGRPADRTRPRVGAHVAGGRTADLVTR